ncbi:MAG: hypothetical protein WCO98_09345 [bacterium]
MLEFGFWEYTAPGGGSVDRYTTADWDMLLDDMAGGGMNSLVLCVKWLTTGYRSRYDWLDQDPNATGISTDNSVIHYAMREARKRGMKIWLLVVGTQYNSSKFGIQPANPDAYWGEFGMYDLDQPGIAERIELLYAEIIELFGEMADGLIAELEFCDRDSTHRIPIYNEWAQAENRPDYDTIKKIAMEPRSYPFLDWRDFSTDRRSVMLKRIESVVRGKGFTGPLTTIVEVGSCDGVMVRNVNLPRLRKTSPTWGVVTYDSIYNRRINRLSSMDYCVVQPRELGYEINYLTRGVMTFGANWDDISDSLDDQWRMVYEDALMFKPDRFWFMGADARNPEGMVCNPIKLPQWGYPDGRTARLAMLKMAKEMGVI